MSFWYLFLGPHRTTYHLNIGVFIRKATEKGLSTLSVPEEEEEEAASMKDQVARYIIYA
jgi:hypothetical protein